jgi:hypothetical protein
MARSLDAPNPHASVPRRISRRETTSACLTMLMPDISSSPPSKRTATVTNVSKDLPQRRTIKLDQRTRRTVDDAGRFYGHLQLSGDARHGSTAPLRSHGESRNKNRPETLVMRKFAVRSARRDFRRAFGWVFFLALFLPWGQFATAEESRVRAKPLFRDFMGLNVHTVQFKPELYRPVTRLVRDYHGFQWDVGGETDYSPRFPMSRNQVNWETLYGGWTKAGYQIDVCLMFDDTLPAKWKNLRHDASSYGFELARFFGPSGKQKLAEAVEIGNEPGKYDDASYRLLFEHAAQGMRRGDPKLQIATCAMYARPSGPYHKDLATVKGLESLYDVINVHSYAELAGYPTWRRSFPEDPQLDFLTKIREVLTWRDTNAPGKQVWLTEFGWDATTKPQATEGDFKKWEGVTDVQQAQYLVRAFLAFAELDLDRAYIFWFNDDDKPTVHASSGLTRNYQPKPAFHAVSQMLSALGDYRFERALTRKPGELCITSFAHSMDMNLSIWVVWSPTGEGRKVNSRIRVPAGTLDRVERMALTGGAPEAVRWARLDGGEVEFEVSESPTYLWLRR